jgi:uncharacterized membrane protein
LRIHALNRHGRVRLSAAAAVGAALLLLLQQQGLGQIRFLIAWIAAVGCYLFFAYQLGAYATPEETEQTASAQDQSGNALLALVIVAAAVSLFAIALVLSHARDVHLSLSWRVAYIVLAALALMASWLLVHASFAFHYAHRYYGDVVAPFGVRDEGLAFPGRERPDYLDFAYFAFVIAMTSQVSDVQVTTHQMRRLVLIHGVVSFAFYTVILALAINIVATVDLTSVL